MNYSFNCIRTFWHTNDGTEVTLFTGLWFLVALLVVRLVMGFELVRSYKLQIAILCILFTSLQTFILGDSDLVNYYVFHAISAFPFVVVGMIMKERRFNVERFNCPSVILALIIFVALAAIQGRVDMRDNVYGINYMVFFLNALIGSYLLFTLTTKVKLTQQTITYSVGTLLILGTHIMVIRIVTNVWYKVFHLPESQLLPFVSGLVVMVAVYYPIKYLWRKQPLLLGK